jgi:hypothetical protein
MGGFLSVQPNVLAGLAVAGLPATNPSPRWIGVRPRFEQFDSNIQLTALQQVDGHTKRAGVVRCLNRNYYGESLDAEHSFFVGSWGKGTVTRPPRDVDIYFLLPVEVYHRFQGYANNKQSALLQEVKNCLSATYPNTAMSGDGQVVVVNFGSYSVEVVPAFELTTSGRYWICHTHNGGSYKETAPWAEVVFVDQADKDNAGNLRPLIRMLKTWQASCSVPIKSFHLEIVAAEFIAQSPWSQQTMFYFDWIIRDFFAFLYNKANSIIVVPGTQECMCLGDVWQSRALNAYQRAVKACEYEAENRVILAGEEWQKIFGTEIPRIPL